MNNCTRWFICKFLAQTSRNYRNWLNNQPVEITNTKVLALNVFEALPTKTIDGKMDGISGNDNQFYNLYINKTSATGEYVSLLTNVHVNAICNLKFWKHKRNYTYSSYVY